MCILSTPCNFSLLFFFFFSSRRRHTRCLSDWSSDVCSSDLADGHRRRLQPTGELLARELHPLVGVENLRSPTRQRLLQGLHAKVAVEAVRQPPRQYVAAVPIQNRQDRKSVV